MPSGSNPSTAYRWGFIALVIIVTLALAWSVWAFASAILWAVVLAVVFNPVKERILRAMPGRENSAAGLTLVVVAAGIIIPVMFLIGAMANEAISLTTRLQSQHVDAGGLFDQILQHLPAWAKDMLDRAGVGDLAALTDRLSANIQSLLRVVASRAFSIGSDVIGFLFSLAISLYLSYVFLVDGRSIAHRIAEVAPLESRRVAVLSENFVSVVRATVKGTIVVAFVQGAAGGIIMALLGVPEPLLWAVVMMFGALLPAIGTGLVWVPAAIYLLATGHIWQGIAMALSGAFLIGSIDNVLRPILVGRATQMPDALVLLTTLGGLSAFGISGLVLGPIIASLFLATWQMVREDSQA